MLLWGSILAVLSSAFFALNSATVRRGVLTGSVAQALAITVPVGVPMFFFGALALGSLGEVLGFSTKDIVMLSAAGIVHFVWGRYCNYRATKAIGSNASIPLQNLDFPLKLGLAIVLLGEVLTPLRIFGIALIMIGGAIAIPRRRKKKQPAPSAALTIITTTAEATTQGASAAAPAATAKPVFVPKYVEGYTFAALSVTGYGFSPLLIRATLEDASIGTSLAGGLISYIAATLVIMALWIKPGQFEHVISVNRTSVKWFLISAVFVGLSHMCRYAALAMVPVTVVAPLQRAGSLFRVIFNWILNRHYEIFDPRLLTGILISVLGGVSLSLTTDFVVSHIPLPQAILDIIDWSWP